MALQDMEASVRGYLITGQEEFLQPYPAALPECASGWPRFKPGAGTTPSQTQRVAGLEPWWRPTGAVAGNPRAAAHPGFRGRQAGLASGKGMVLTEEMRRQMDEAQQEEDRLL